MKIESEVKVQTFFQNSKKKKNNKEKSYHKQLDRSSGP